MTLTINNLNELEWSETITKTFEMKEQTLNDLPKAIQDRIWNEYKGMNHYELGKATVSDLKRLGYITKPFKGEIVKWKTPMSKKTYSVKIASVKLRDKICKVVQDFTIKNTMPYQYFWVDFAEIGYE